MTIPLPSPLPVTSSWAVADWLDRSYTSPPADGAGAAQVVVPALPDFERWQITHMVASCTSGAVTQMRLYLDDVRTGDLRDGTDSGNFDVGGWPQGLWLPPGRALLARWEGCSPGAVATLALQATVLRRVGS